MDKADFDELIAEARRSYEVLHRQFVSKQKEVHQLEAEVKRLTAERDRINSQIRSVRERLGV